MNELKSYTVNGSLILSDTCVADAKGLVTGEPVYLASDVDALLSRDRGEGGGMSAQ